ncbi:conjugal transfer protein MobB [Alistipes sp. An116]|uniref:conjugal transfer protein MobB n=1 Tax=Alistipes sp. An116 TaxID=1965546 RepID=UPI001EF43757|nr:conjugal transfer protein MobB [Alistipes sp. An116]
MVANIRTGATVGGAIRYNEEKVNRGQAEVLCWNRMLDPFDSAGRMSHERCMASFEPFLQANRRTTNTVFLVSLNPSPEDRLTDEQLGKIAREYMERMGYGEQPYIVFKHGDIAREHLHIVSLRVDSTGRKISDSHEYDRSMSILRDLEQKYGLHPSIKGQEQTDREGLRKVNYPDGNVKRQVSSVVRACLRNYKCSSYSELRTLLERFNVSVEERTGTIDGRNFAGIIYGTMTDDGYGIGTPFKSSRIGMDVGYEALQRYYERSKTALKEPGALDELREKIADGMARSSSRAEFCERLHDKGVDAVFRLNAAGRIYGVTFIDHEQEIVANGSLLGRSFSANAFEQQFHTEAKSRGGLPGILGAGEVFLKRIFSAGAVYPSVGCGSGIGGRTGL